LTSDDISF